jgi:Protein of unknown function (DUF402)
VLAPARVSGSFSGVTKDIPAAWTPGDAVVPRYITRDGRPGMSWPFTVVRDTPELLALFIPRGAIYKRWQVTDAGRALVDTPWRNDVLRLMFPGRGHSVWLFWSHDDGDRRLASYYINMEEPFRRTRIGFDTNDHMLDVMVTPDLAAWHWKDDEDFARAVERGIYGAEFAEAVRAEAREVIERLERRESPFSDGWGAWSPEPHWASPGLHPDWDKLPATLWERRTWAYLDPKLTLG